MSAAAQAQQGHQIRALLARRVKTYAAETGGHVSSFIADASKQCRSLCLVHYTIRDGSNLQLTSGFASRQLVALSENSNTMRTASSGRSGEMFLNCVQVKLAEASIRPGQSQEWLQRAEQRVLASVKASSAEIVCHCGTWSASLQLHRLSRYACC